ncbi:hypothetical protein EMCRGX_G016599 [Ephydatia muelleri]
MVVVRQNQDKTIYGFYDIRTLDAKFQDDFSNPYTSSLPGTSETGVDSTSLSCLQAVQRGNAASSPVTCKHGGMLHHTIIHDKRSALSADTS